MPHFIECFQFIYLLIEKMSISNDYQCIEQFIEELFEIYIYINYFYIFVYVIRFQQRSEG